MEMCWVVNTVNDYIDWVNTVNTVAITDVLEGAIIHPTQVLYEPSVINKKKMMNFKPAFSFRIIAYVLLAYLVRAQLAIRCRWLLWSTFKNNIVTGQLQYGSVVLWYCFDLQQMGPAAALEIPWYPCKEKTLNPLPPFYIQELFIWTTPPNPLFNDMSHYPLDTAKGETLGFWKGVTRMPWRNTSLKWISEELDFGMITAHRICIPTGKIWLWKCYLDTVIHCQGFFFF